MRHRERKPPSDDTLVAQHGGRDDRHFLWNWHPEAAEQEHGENAEVRKVVEELLESLHGVLTQVSSVMDGYTRTTKPAGPFRGSSLDNTPFSYWHGDDP